MSFFYPDLANKLLIEPLYPFVSPSDFGLPDTNKYSVVLYHTNALYSLIDSAPVDAFPAFQSPENYFSSYFVNYVQLSTFSKTFEAQGLGGLYYYDDNTSSYKILDNVVQSIDTPVFLVAPEGQIWPSVLDNIGFSLTFSEYSSFDNSLVGAVNDPITMRLSSNTYIDKLGVVGSEDWIYYNTLPSTVDLANYSFFTNDQFVDHFVPWNGPDYNLVLQFSTLTSSLPASDFYASVHNLADLGFKLKASADLSLQSYANLLLSNPIDIIHKSNSDIYVTTFSLPSTVQNLDVINQLLSNLVIDLPKMPDQLLLSSSGSNLSLTAYLKTNAIDQSNSLMGTLVGIPFKAFNPVNVVDTASAKTLTAKTSYKITDLVNIDMPLADQQYEINLSMSQGAFKFDKLLKPLLTSTDNVKSKYDLKLTGSASEITAKLDQITYLTSSKSIDDVISVDVYSNGSLLSASSANLIVGVDDNLSNYNFSDNLAVTKYSALESLSIAGVSASEVNIALSADNKSLVLTTDSGVGAVELTKYKSTLKGDKITFEDQSILYYNQSSKTVIKGSAGSDNLTAGKNGDLIKAGAGNDLITLGAGNDIAVAGAGNDTVILGAGNDTVTLGAGSDLLVLDVTKGVNHRVLDFDVSEDQLKLVNLTSIDTTQLSYNNGVLSLGADPLVTFVGNPTLNLSELIA